MIIDFFFVTCNTWHLLALNCILHLRDHELSVSRSFCSDTQSASDLIWWKSSASSANNLIVPDMPLLMSFIYVKNMSGPSTVPWGTPESTGTSCDALPSTTIRCVRHVRCVLSHSCASPRTPLASNFLRRWRWGTLSNAFWRSSNMISCWYFWSIPFWSCSVVVTSYVAT